MAVPSSITMTIFFIYGKSIEKKPALLSKLCKNGTKLIKTKTQLVWFSWLNWLNLSLNLQSNSVSSQHLGQSSHQLLPEAIYSAQGSLYVREDLRYVPLQLFRFITTLLNEVWPNLELVSKVEDKWRTFYLDKTSPDSFIVDILPKVEDLAVLC